MTPLASCPRCAQNDAVRREHVIQAGRSYLAYDCRSCGHQWHVLETGEHVPSDFTDITDRPDRSRPNEP